MEKMTVEQIKEIIIEKYKLVNSDLDLQIKSKNTSREFVQLVGQFHAYLDLMFCLFPADALKVVTNSDK